MTKRILSAVQLFADIFKKLLLLLLLLLFQLPSFSSAQTVETNKAGEDDFEEILPEPLDSYRYALLKGGYRFINANGADAFISPYVKRESGTAAEVSAAIQDEKFKLSFDSAFFHADDYRSELFLDYGDLLRMYSLNEAFWHNLPAEQMNSGTLLPVTDATNNYGVRSAITETKVRIKPGNNPFHIDLGYWQLTREGSEQLRFSDHVSGSPGTLIFQPRQVNSVTREGQMGLAAHLGFFDISYNLIIRDFVNDAADPRYIFTNNIGGAVIAQPQVHNAIPDSRVTSHTLKLYSDLSGGLIGAASYNLTQRENNGGHGEAVPSSQPSDMIHNIAGDLSFTPVKHISLALKYRHQEIERDSPATVNYPFASPVTLLVRPSSDSVRDSFILSATMRSDSNAIYRLEYSAELEKRNNLRDSGSSPGPPYLLHSDSRQTHTGAASVSLRPYKGVKLSSFYSYSVSDSQDYISSFSDRHKAKLLLTYTNCGKWGATASYLGQYETGENTASTVAPAPVASYLLPRKHHSGSGNAGVWFSPAERLTITTSYSYLVTDTDQSVLFSSLISDANPLVVTNYSSSAHIYGIDAVYAISEPVDISASFQQSFSRSRFNVPFRSFSLAGVAGPFDTSGITQLTSLDYVESAVSGRADWRISSIFGCSFDYNYRRFDSGNSDYDGSVHTAMLMFKAKW